MAQTLNVQFADSTDVTIVSYFGGPQNPAAYANLGTVSTTDARWSTFYAALPASAQPGVPAPGA
jgi:hypothetical protein